MEDENLKPITRFDKTEEYESEIIDLITQLRISCNRNKIPMFVSICIKNDEHGSLYKNEMVGAASSGINLKDDKLVGFVNVINGFDTVPKREEIEIDF